MTAHTPGPWTADQGLIRSRKGGVCGTIYVDPPRGEKIEDHEISRDESLANAILIAAAPGLLAALTDLLAQVDIRCGGKAEGNSALVAAADAGRAAINKAMNR